MKKVIDGDKMELLEEFAPSKSQEIKEKYEKLGKWEEVEFDGDGHLILFEEE